MSINIHACICTYVSTRYECTYIHIYVQCRLVNTLSDNALFRLTGSGAVSHRAINVTSRRIG